METKMPDLAELKNDLENCQKTADKLGLMIVAIYISQALDKLTHPPQESTGSFVNDLC